MVRGDIHVADYHANLIYNAGGGTAARPVRGDQRIEIAGARAVRDRDRGRGAVRGLVDSRRLDALAVALLLAGRCAADLHQAVQSGNLDAVREQVARGADVNERDAMGATPLHDAAWSGHLEIAAFLIEHGAEVRAQHAEGGSEPLAYAVIKNNRRRWSSCCSRTART